MTTGVLAASTLCTQPIKPLATFLFWRLLPLSEGRPVSQPSRVPTSLVCFIPLTASQLTATAQGSSPGRSQATAPFGGRRRRLGTSGWHGWAQGRISLHKYGSHPQRLSNSGDNSVTI